jgi:type I restriction enzyme S subunit
MTTLDELCELIVDCEHKTAPIQEYGIPSIRTPNIGRGYFLLEGVNRVSEETYVAWTKRAIPQGGDLILAREAPVGNVAVIPSGEHYCLGQRTVLIRPKRNLVDSYYLCFLLLSPQLQGQLLGKSSGATVHHLNMKDIRALSIPTLPALAEQHRTASIIRAYDDLIATNQRRITLLEEAARRIYREWFVALRFTGHESVPVKDGVPEGWLKSSISEQTSFFNRGIAPKYDDMAKGRVINQKCIRDGRISMGPARRQSKEVKPDRLVQMGDVLINSTGAGTLGRVAQVRSPIEDCTVDTHVTIARPINEDSSTYFGQALLNLEPIFSDMGKGATNQLELSRADIGAVKIWQPAKHLIVEFDQFVRPMLEQAEQLSVANLSLVTARDLLLPKLMSGQLDVSSIQLSDEVAL